MRVLRVVSSLNPNLGGASVAALNSAIAGARAGVSSDVAVMVWRNETSSQWWREVETRCANEAVGLMSFPASSGRALHSPRDLSMSLLTWLMKQRGGDYDIVHAESPWTGACATALVASLRRTSPLVISPHEVLTPFGMSRGSRGKRTARRIGAGLYGRLASLVVCSSPLEMHDTRASGIPAAKLDWIYHAVLDDMSHHDSPPHLATDGQGLRVGYLGRIDQKKNVGLIIDAVALLGEDVSLVVAGRGDPQLEEGLRRQAERLMLGRASFVGWVSGPEKSAFLAGIDTLVMPSAYECFGVAAVEALAAGVPVIVSDRVGVAEIVRAHQVGAVVPPTATAIAGALRRYLDDPACRTADANRARAAALADASFAAHGSRLVEVYTSLLESQRR